MRRREKTVHTYYAKSKDKLKKDMNKMLSLIRPELEEASGKKYGDMFAEIWRYYEAELLERFPYIGGKRISGTRNLTGAYSFVAMGEVLKKHGIYCLSAVRLKTLFSFYFLSRFMPSRI